MIFPILVLLSSMGFANSNEFSCDIKQSGESVEFNFIEKRPPIPADDGRLFDLTATFSMSKKAGSTPGFSYFESIVTVGYPYFTLRTTDNGTGAWIHLNQNQGRLFLKGKEQKLENCDLFEFKKTFFK